VRVKHHLANRSIKMCGINGIFAYHYAANPVDGAELTRTRDHMARRGPDGSGAWLSGDERVGLGHRRLAFIDLSEAGAQPMASADGQLMITFNGEIYNYRELRRDLEAKGRVFRSNSDTEVLLQLYAEKGSAMVHDLRGMFAFALWDEQRRQMVLARDPYGIKPLYYADDGWTFRFASQVKALLSGGAVSRDPDPAGLTGFYLFGSVPEPFTTWRAIRSLPAGCTMVVDRSGAGAPARYHSIASVYQSAETMPAPAARGMDAIQAALRDSVRSHLIADVPVGAFLSAGIDSTALVGLMRDAGASDIQTITIGFEEFRAKPQDEAPLAAEVARLYGTRHTSRVVTKREFEADLPLIMEAMDQPSIDGINTWFVSKAAHELGLKAAISGLGGDEAFGGYPSFRDLPRWVGALAVPSRIPLLGRAASMLATPLAGAFGANPKAAGMLEFGGTYAGAYLLRRGLFMPAELGHVLDPDTIRDGLRRLAPLDLIAGELKPTPRSAFARVATLESALYMRNQLLRDTDWASMAHSLEVRVPLVDSVLLAELARHTPLIAGAQGKQILARAPGQALPASVTERRKTGFTTPVDMWMQSRVGQRTGNARTTGTRVLPWARDWSRVVGQELQSAS
jgi:asparagine synthase (glutamine-hydrolysing)